MKQASLYALPTATQAIQNMHLGVLANMDNMLAVFRILSPYIARSGMKV